MSHHQPFKVSNRFQLKRSQIVSVLITVERAVDVRAGVGNHLDLPNLECRSRRVPFSGSIAAEKVRDNRRWQSFVSNQAVLNRVRKVYESWITHFASTYFGGEQFEMLSRIWSTRRRLQSSQPLHR